MKKKAGTFFKNVLSKGKKIIKKDSPDKEGEDFNTEEDNDIIEVKGGRGLLQGFQEIAGNTMLAADHLLHHGIVVDGESSSKSNSRSDSKMIARALLTSQTTSLEPSLYADLNRLDFKDQFPGQPQYDTRGEEEEQKERKLM